MVEERTSVAVYISWADDNGFLGANLIEVFDTGDDDETVRDAIMMARILNIDPPVCCEGMGLVIPLEDVAKHPPMKWNTLLQREDIPDAVSWTPEEHETRHIGDV